MYAAWFDLKCTPTGTSGQEASTFLRSFTFLLAYQNACWLKSACLMNLTDWHKIIFNRDGNSIPIGDQINNTTLAACALVNDSGILRVSRGVAPSETIMPGGGWGGGGGGGGGGVYRPSTRRTHKFLSGGSVVDGDACRMRFFFRFC